MRPLVAALARRPDIETLSAKLSLDGLTPEETREALAQCLEYIEKVDLVVEELRDKCAETARLLE